jgi:NAD(P)-dependent dehydrogenase (short-subunit alcohol dehydrogenase family)
MSESLPQTPSFDLTGRRAVVTGAGRGIGIGVAAALAQAGASVTLAARSGAEIEAVAASLRASGHNAIAEVLDVSDQTAVTTFFEEQAAFDVLVNNAGTNRPKSILEITEEDYDAVLDLNLKSVVFVSQACARKMIDANIRGSIIHMSSQMGHVSGPGRSLYSASKWGLEGFNKGLALDLAPFGIRSNTICPTFIETPMTRPFFEDEKFLKSVLSKIKIGRLGQVEDVMGSVLFLASDASALMTGSSLMLDGGWTAE